MLRPDSNAALHQNGHRTRLWPRTHAQPRPPLEGYAVRRERLPRVDRQHAAARLQALPVRMVRPAALQQDSRLQVREEIEASALGRVARMKIRVILEVFQRQARMMLGFLVAGLRDLLDGKDQRLNGTF